MKRLGRKGVGDRGGNPCFWYIKKTSFRVFKLAHVEQ